MKEKQELQFIIDRICATWGIVCYILGKHEDSIVCMSHMDEMNPVIGYQEKTDVISAARAACENHAILVLYPGGEQVYYFAFLCDEELLFLPGPFVFARLRLKKSIRFAGSTASTIKCIRCRL